MFRKYHYTIIQSEKLSAVYKRAQHRVYGNGATFSDNLYRLRMRKIRASRFEWCSKDIDMPSVLLLAIAIMSPFAIIADKIRICNNIANLSGGRVAALNMIKKYMTRFRLPRHCCAVSRNDEGKRKQDMLNTTNQTPPPQQSIIKEMFRLKAQHDKTN